MSRISVASSLAIILLVGLTAGAQSSERGVAPPTVDRPITNYYQIMGVVPQESPNFPKSSSQLPTKARQGTNEFFGLYLDGDKPSDPGYAAGAENCFTVPALSSGTPPTGFYYLFDNVTNDDVSYDGFIDLGYLYCGEDPPQGTDPLDLLTTNVIDISFIYQVNMVKGASYDWLVMSCETRCWDGAAGPTVGWESCAADDYYPTTIPKILDSSPNPYYSLASSLHSWQKFQCIPPDGAGGAPAINPAGQQCPSGSLVQVRIGLGTYYNTYAEACYSNTLISY